MGYPGNRTYPYILSQLYLKYTSITSMLTTKYFIQQKKINPLTGSYKIKDFF